MKINPGKLSNLSAWINLLAGVLWIVAAFHPITGEPGIDYWFILFGVFFLAAGILGLLAGRKSAT